MPATIADRKKDEEVGYRIGTCFLRLKKMSANGEGSDRLQRHRRWTEHHANLLVRAIELKKDPGDRRLMIEHLADFMDSSEAIAAGIAAQDAADEAKKAAKAMKVMKRPSKAIIDDRKGDHRKRPSSGHQAAIKAFRIEELKKMPGSGEGSDRLQAHRQWTHHHANLLMQAIDLKEHGLSRQVMIDHFVDFMNSSEENDARIQAQDAADEHATTAKAMKAMKRPSKAIIDDRKGDHRTSKAMKAMKAIKALKFKEMKTMVVMKRLSKATKAMKAMKANKAMKKATKAMKANKAMKKAKKALKAKKFSIFPEPTSQEWGPAVITIDEAKDAAKAMKAKKVMKAMKAKKVMKAMK